MGILLREAGLEEKARIVATDLNETALKQAQTGVFKLKNQLLNQKNYGSLNGKNDLAVYYKNDGNNVVYDSSLIRNVKFIKHDLSSEQQLAKFDLIICRNVLIYFSFNLQDRVLQHFYDSLKAGSYLGIGSKESIYRTKIEKLVEIESYEEKIFRKP
jgi:chemotaxis protein methyltransferase CheR